MTKSKLIYLLLLLMVILTFLQLSGGQSNFLFVLSLSILFFAAIRFPVESMGIYAIFSLAGSMYDASPYIFVVFAIGCIINSFFKKKQYKIYPKKECLIMLLFLSSVLISYLVNDSAGSIYILLTCEVIVFYKFVFIKEELSPELASILEIEFLTTSFLCSYFSMLSATDMTTRLRFLGTGNVRNLANFIGIAIVLSIFNLKKDDTSVNKIIRLITIAIQFIVLLMTGSRGVLYSIVITIILFLALQKKKIPYLIMFGIVLLALIKLVPMIIPDSYDINRLLEFDNSSRIEIWKMIIIGTKPTAWIFGAGLNSASKLYGWYSHSVFLDCATSLGLPAFVALISQLICAFAMSYKYKNIRQFCLIVYLFLSFATHGTIFNTTFWLLFAIAILQPKTNEINTEATLCD